MPKNIGYGGGSTIKKKGGSSHRSSHGSSHKMSTEHRLKEIRKRGRKHKKE